MAKVFISYIQENSLQATSLSQLLIKRGITVWMDKDSLLPGMRWKTSIRDAIQSGDFFIACFSKEYYQRDRSYMNEELMIALEELRLRTSDRAWFIPVILNECNVPAQNIGAGETLLDLHWVNLHFNWEEGIKKITQVILSDELEVVKNELDSRARWISKKEASQTNNNIVEGYVQDYNKVKNGLFEKFGIHYDPRAKQPSR